VPAGLLLLVSVCRQNVLGNPDFMPLAAAGEEQPLSGRIECEEGCQTLWPQIDRLQFTGAELNGCDFLPSIRI
jgi:hypothetical protein